MVSPAIPIRPFLGDDKLGSLLEGHDLIWDTLPERWEDAPFLGNGLTGTLPIFDAGSNSLRWFLCRSDVGKVDHPGMVRDPNRIPIGTLNQRFPDTVRITGCIMRMDLWNAELRGELTTSAGPIFFRALAPSGTASIVIEFRSGSELTWHWESGILPAGTLTELSDRTIFEAPDAVRHPRSELASGGFAVVWGEMSRGDSVRRFIFSIGSSPVNRSFWNAGDSGATAVAEAVGDFERFVAAGTDDIVSLHRDWWHCFYRQSFFSISDSELEAFYWIQLYKFASSSRPDRPMIDNHGIWTTEPKYGYATWDYNVQSTYRMHLAGNFCDFGNPLTKFLESNFNETTMWDPKHGEYRARMRQQTFLRYRHFDSEENAGQFPGLPAERNRQPESARRPTPCDGPAKFLWGVHNYLLHYRHHSDPAMIPRMLLMLEAGINAMLAGMEVEEDGSYHIPFGRSWESWYGKDPTVLLIILRWALETAIEYSAGVSDEKVDRWRDVLGRLAPYPVGEVGFLLGVGQAPIPHRHWSQLKMLFPFDIVDWDDADQIRILRQSIDHWAAISAGLDGTKPEAGFACPAAICLYAWLHASVGGVDLSVIPQLARTFLYGDSKRGQILLPSTMYREAGPVIETPLFMASALQECLLQSRKDGIHVFPAVPSEWPDAVFANWHAEGGFTISAKRSKGLTEWIVVESACGGLLRLHCDLENGSSSVNKKLDPVTGRRLPSGKFLIERQLSAGETLDLGSRPETFAVGPVNHVHGDRNAFGLSQRFRAKRPGIEC